MSFHHCDQCGKPSELVRYRDQVDFKGLTLDIDGLVKSVCSDCNKSWTTPGQHRDNLALMKAAYVKRRDEIRVEQGLLSGDDIARALRLLNLNKAQAAELFGGGPNAFGKYLNGEVLQSFAMDRLIRLTVAGGDKAVELLQSSADSGRQLELSSLFKTGYTTIVIALPASDLSATINRGIAANANSTLV